MKGRPGRRSGPAKRLLALGSPARAEFHARAASWRGDRKFNGCWLILPWPPAYHRCKGSRAMVNAIPIYLGGFSAFVIAWYSALNSGLAIVVIMRKLLIHRQRPHPRPAKTAR